MKKTIYTLLLLLVSQFVFAQAGSLDLTFASTGKILSTSSMDTSLNALTIQSDGKIIVAGYEDGPNYHTIRLMRYTTTGTLDATFGTAGIVSYVSPNITEAKAIALQSDGKIIVAGYESNIGTNLIFLRYTSLGVLDATYGTAGVARVFAPSSKDFNFNVPISMAIQTDNKIVIGTYYDDFTNYATYVTRLSSTGIVDNSFGTNGYFSNSLNVGYNTSVEGIALQSDGKIVVVGGVFDEDANFLSISKILVMRLTSSGTLDNSFNSNGIVQYDINAASVDIASDVTIQTDGKIVICGSTGGAFSSDMIAVRFNSNGSIDNSFGTSGKVIKDVQNTSNLGSSIAIQSDGGIVIAGNHANALGIQLNIYKLTSNGSFDNTFGTAGVSVILHTGRDLTPEQMKLQSDGKIVVAGQGGGMMSNGGYFAGNFVCRINNAATSTSVIDFDKHNSIILYPNPTTDYFTLESDKLLSDNNLVSIYSMNGQLVYSNKISSLNNKISVGNLNAGIYTIYLSNQEGKYSSTLQIVK